MSANNRTAITQLALCAGMLITFDEERSKELVLMIQELLEVYMDEINERNRPAFIDYAKQIFDNTEKTAKEMQLPPDSGLVYNFLIAISERYRVITRYKPKLILWEQINDKAIELSPTAQAEAIEEADRAIEFEDQVTQIIKKKAEE